MGRAERRRKERIERIEGRKDRVTMTRQELYLEKEKARQDVLEYNVEALMTCFALANHRLYGHGQKRISRSLQYIDELMGDIIDGKTTIEQLKDECENETGVRIKCD